MKDNSDKESAEKLLNFALEELENTFNNFKKGKSEYSSKKLSKLLDEMEKLESNKNLTEEEAKKWLDNTSKKMGL